MKLAHQIVFIMTDTTRWDMLGCYGNKDMKTPNLDQLATEGVLFKKAYSCQPVCGPARSAIFTGQYPHSNGVVANTMAISQGIKTIGEYLNPHSIDCGYIGKWHLDGGDYFGNGICPNGYNKKYWYDMRCYLDELSLEERVRSRNESASISANGVNEDFTFGHRVINRAIDYIDEFKDKDFFLTVSLDEPHGPHLCPEPYASMYKDYKLKKTPNYYDSLNDKPMYQKLWAEKELKADDQNDYINRQLFFGCNSYADYEIGRVIKKIKEKIPNAMIFFTSDHGDAMGAHHISNKGPSVYEEIAHIPLIVKGGAYMNSTGNSNYNHVVSHIDLVPTILDYFDIEKPKVLPGKSLREIISNPNNCNVLNDSVFCEFHRYEIDHDGYGGLQLMRAVITDKSKLQINLLDEIDELYDTEKDPYELVNLIEDKKYSQLRDSLHSKLLQWMNDTRDPYRGYQWKRRSWNKDSVSLSWECDGYTRQRPSEKNELKQLDYDTGLEIDSYVRPKK